MSPLSVGYGIMKNAAGLALDTSQFCFRIYQPPLIFCNPRCDSGLLILKLYAKWLRTWSDYLAIALKISNSFFFFLIFSFFFLHLK